MPDKTGPILSLRPETFSNSIPIATTWLLADCTEFRGKQGLWESRKPAVLKALRMQAMVQSVESSNRIEGVTVEQDRLAPLVLHNSRPRNRPEEELAGYRQALRWIVDEQPHAPTAPETILHLHELCQGYGEGAAFDAGKWKARDNEIIEVVPGEGRRVRFVPTSAKDTPRAMADLHHSYQQLSEDRAALDLLLAATFILDFLCIHPFRDGNGRVSRLLTTLLLEHHGYGVGRFISLERLIEESRETYYEVLAQCSRDWATGKNTITPWWNYLLGIMRRAYAELEERIESTADRSVKADLARAAILRRLGPFALSEIVAEAPGCSEALIKKALLELKNTGRIALTGRGRGATWRVLHHERPE
jgi:Fic family protein